MQSIVLGHLDCVNLYKYPEWHEDFGPTGSVPVSPLPLLTRGRLVPLLMCGLQPFCSRGLRPAVGKTAHLHQYSGSRSLYFDVTLRNVGNKQNTAVREREKTVVPITVSFWFVLLGKWEETNRGFFRSMALRIETSVRLGVLKLCLWGKGAGLFGNRSFVGKVYLQPRLGPCGFTANKEISCFWGPYSCPHWDLLFQGKVFGKAGSEQTVGKGKDLGWDETVGEIETGVGLSESDVLANTARAGVSSRVCWLVLLENRRLSHFRPAENVVSIAEWCGLAPQKC